MAKAPLGRTSKDQVEADRLLAEALRKQWEEEDGVVEQHLSPSHFHSPNLVHEVFDISHLDEDYELARRIQAEGDVEPTDVNMTGSVIDPMLELTDPNPDIWHLFRCFDARFFDRQLISSGVELSWSPRMTMCAGLCGWNPKSRACFIRLSKPLLELRPRKDLVETLIHEMIHALLFVQRIDDNHESHGKVFHREMYRINATGKCNITVYHNFHDEVKHFKSHVWRCSGPCRDLPPYHGWVRRAMNRAPGPTDFWYHKHQATCGGTWTKVSEPEKVIKKSDKSGHSKKGPKKLKQNNSKKIASPKSSPIASQDLRNFFTHVTVSPSTSNATASQSSSSFENCDDQRSKKSATTIFVEIELD